MSIMGDLGRYFLDLVRHMPNALMSDFDTEEKKTLAVLAENRKRMLAEASISLDRPRAVEMAHFASLAYKLNGDEKIEVESFLEGGQRPLSASYSLVKVMSNPSTDYSDAETPRGFIAESNDTEGEIVVSVRGTSDTFDWLINGLYYKADSLVMHEGYALLGAWVWVQLRDAFSLDVLNQKRRVTFTGHSLGGATALIAAWLTAKAIANTATSGPTVEVYTFGAPQVEGTVRVQHPLAFSVPEHKFAMAADLVAGFGLREDETRRYLVGAKGSIYSFDNSRASKIIRLFELVRLAHGRKGANDTHLCLILLKIQEAWNNDTPLEEDAILSTEANNFPPPVSIFWHGIDQYLTAISHEPAPL